jgi:predicted DNA-binding transcriptional regulator AlpA
MVGRYLRFADLRERGIIPTRPTLRNRIRRHGFPRGRLIGPNMCAWLEEEVAEWLASQPTGPKPVKPPKPKRPRGRPRKHVHAQSTTQNPAEV